MEGVEIEGDIENPTGVTDILKESQEKHYEIEDYPVNNENHKRKGYKPTFLSILKEHWITTTILFAVFLATIFLVLWIWRLMIGYPSQELIMSKKNGDYLLSSHCSKRNERKVVLEDATPQDLYCLGDEVEDVHITSVKSYLPKSTPHPHQKKSSVRNLIISCQLSEEWLSILLETFPYVEGITYDENALCNELFGKNLGNFPNHYFPVLHTLVIQNANRKCPTVSELVFTKWQTPALKNFKIRNSNLNEDFFNYVKIFLNKAINTIETIEVLDSYICKDCDIFGIKFSNIRQVTIKSPNKF